MSRDKYDELETINEAYPNRFKAFEFKKCRIPQNYWCDRNNRIDAIRQLIEEKLKYSHNEVVDKLTIEDFYNNKLTTLIENYYNESISKAVIEAYGEEYMPWEFGYHRWNEEDAKKATVWLIDKLKREKGEAPSEISYYNFQDNKLRIVIDKYYNSSPRKAVLDVG